MSYKKPKVDESMLINNPFANDMYLRHKSYVKKNNYLTADDVVNNEMYKLHKFGEEIIVEVDSSTKVYTRAGFRLDIFSRTEKARSLFLWLIYEIESGKDFLWLNKNRYMTEASVSLNTYKSAVEELCLNKVITPTIYPEYFWINPVYFFNGNRLKKYPNNLVHVK